MDHQPVLVDEVVLGQRADQLATAVDQDVLARLLLQPERSTSCWTTQAGEASVSPTASNRASTSV